MLKHISLLLILISLFFSPLRAQRIYKSSQVQNIELHLEPYFNSTKLSIRSLRTLDKLAQILQHFPELKVQIEVHGSDFDFEKNKRISKSESLLQTQNQAQEIQDYLVNKGFAQANVQALGRGQEEPYLLKDSSGTIIGPLPDSPYAKIKNARIQLLLMPKYSDDQLNLELELEAGGILYQ